MLKKPSIFIGMLVLVLFVTGVYLTIHTYGNWHFAWALRSKKIFAFILVSLAVSSATISFQTITHNQFLTPSVLGLESLYVLVQTVLFFFIGGVTMLQQTGTGFFLLNVGLMVGLSLLLFFFLLKKMKANLFLLLMSGMILGTLFGSVSTFLQVIMDPNEYDLLQGRLFASFGNIQSQYLLPASLIIIGCWYLLFRYRHVLDVFHLGNEQAVNLGIDTNRFEFLILCCVSVFDRDINGSCGSSYFFRVYCRKCQLPCIFYLSSWSAIYRKLSGSYAVSDRRTARSRADFRLEYNSECRC